MQLIFPEAESGPRVPDSKWLPVEADSEYTLNLQLLSLNLRKVAHTLSIYTYK